MSKKVFLAILMAVMVAVFLPSKEANATSEKFVVQGYPANDQEMRSALLNGLPRQYHYGKNDYHQGNMPDFVAFNQMQDNPVFGDETEAPYWLTAEDGRIITQLKAGAEYTVHYYLHTTGKAAKGVRMRAWPADFYFSDTSYAGKCLTGPRLGVEINPENGSEFEFFPAGWYADEAIYISYVPHSVELSRLDGAKSWKIDEFDFFSLDGALIGDEELDGTLHTGYENAVEITFKITTKAYAGKTLAFLANEENDFFGENTESVVVAEPISTSSSCGGIVLANAAETKDFASKSAIEEKPSNQDLQKQQSKLGMEIALVVILVFAIVVVGIAFDSTTNK